MLTSHLQAVVRVHHGRHPVEAEAVELVLLQPPPQVGQQEAHHLEEFVTRFVTSILTRVKTIVQVQHGVSARLFGQTAPAEPPPQVGQQEKRITWNTFVARIEV